MHHRYWVRHISQANRKGYNEESFKIAGKIYVLVAG